MTPMGQPQPPYTHQEYPKIIGYREDGRAIVAQSEEHHVQLKAAVEAAAKAGAKAKAEADKKKPAAAGEPAA